MISQSRGSGDAATARAAALTVISLFESEDPISPGDSVTPITPIMHIATDETGATNSTTVGRVVNVGVPSLAIIEALYAALDASQQTTLLANLSTYIAQRGWLENLTALSDLAAVETRYEPSGRQWALRMLAHVTGVTVTDLYQTKLRVDPITDRWVAVAKD